MPHSTVTPAKFAQQLKAANELHGNPEATIGDLFRVADALGVSAADLMRMRNPATGSACGCPDDRCAGYHHDADLEHCPCADSLAMDDAR